MYFPRYRMTQMECITIRTAKPDDISCVCEFVTQLADYEHLADELEIKSDSFSEYLFGEAEPPRPQIFLAELCDDHDPVGFALFIPILSSTVYLEDLFVSVGCRGKGVGTRLLSGIAKYTIARGANALEWACLKWNKPSLDFYYSLGARPATARSIYRIVAEVSLHEQKKDPDSYRVETTRSIPDEIDQSLKVIQALDSFGNIAGSLYYTLSFSTFKSTPVVLVISFDFQDNWAAADNILDHLVSFASDRKYKRIDIRLNPTRDTHFSKLLKSHFHAVEMTDWIGLSLEADDLLALANRN